MGFEIGRTLADLTERSERLSGKEKRALRKRERQELKLAETKKTRAGVSLKSRSSFEEIGRRGSESQDERRETFTRYPSLDLFRSSESERLRPAAATSPPPAHFPDSVAISTYDVADVGKVLPGPANAAFERALARAFATYSPAEDRALMKARAEGGADTSFAFPSTGWAGPHAAQARAVAERLEGMPSLSADEKRILTQAASFAVGPAGEPLIRGLQALKIGETLGRMPAERRAAIGELLGSAKNDFERALILKCVSPRASRLFSSSAEGDTAMAEIQSFASAIRGAPLAFLEERATVVFKGAYGLKSYSQQKGNSCVAAAIRRAMATEDPFLNWILRAEKTDSSWGSEGRTAQEFEEAILYGDKSGEYQLSHGLNPDDAAKQFLSPQTHLDYKKVKYFYRLFGDPHHSERLAQVVLAGQPVLLRSGDPEDRESNYSHCVLLLWARGEPGKREFLVADGHADWTSQSSFEHGRFSHYYGDSHPTIGVGRIAGGRPET
jgi:hypothetical protein